MEMVALVIIAGSKAEEMGGEVSLCSHHAAKAWSSGKHA